MEVELMEEIIKFNSTTLKAIQKDGEMYSLNDLWRMLGSPQNLDPRQWVRLPDTVRYLESESSALNVRKSHIIKSKRGKGGGTYATQRVFLEYARYLNKDLAKQRIEKRNLQGVEHCVSTCKDAASAISKAIQDFLE